MSNFILAGLFTEGSTDVRFLSSVVQRTLDEVAFDCTGDIETEVEAINIDKTELSFNEQVLEASRVAFETYGISLLFVHTDSDNEDDSFVNETKLIPAQNLLSFQDPEAYCKHIVPIIPIRMTESWMIADRNLLKEEIGINKTNPELGIHVNPESINDPKATIENIIRLSKEDVTKRKRNKGLHISDLYQIIGQKVELEELKKLSSYSKFRETLIQKLRDLNFYHK